MIGSLSFERPEFLWTLLLALPLVASALWSRRKLTPVRRAVILLARLALLLLLSLAASGVTWLRPVDDLGVVFVLDRSASVGGAGVAAEEAFVRDALRAQGENDLAGVVVFGAEAVVETAPKSGLEFHGVESRPSPHQSDLSGALRLASGLLPADRARRIVLLSDGEETRGDVATQALLSAGEDLQIGVVPIKSQHGADVVVEDLVVPSRTDEGAAFDVRVVARSDVPTTGKIRLYRNDAYLGELPVTLSGGRSDVFTVRQEGGAAGLYRYRAVVEVADPKTDSVLENDESVGTVQVTGRPRVLYAEGYPAQSDALRSVLETEGLGVDVVDAAGVPATLSGFRPYAAVILSDIPAYALSNRQQDAVHAYVHDLGRGLVMVGGDQSFGLGGYFHTPVEDALPVTMDIKDKSRFPKLAMVHAIDKSCSMGDGAGSKLEMAKSASKLTAELLSERDALGLIGFDDTPSWVLPLQPLTDKPGAVSLIGSLRVGGGTDILPAIVKADDALGASDAALKHLVVMSDGISAPGDFERELRRATASGITVSTIAIGDDADQQTMTQLASWGGGQFYLVKDPTAIPKVFTREALLASGSFLIEDPISPKLKEPSDILRGVAALPTLGGMVATEAKSRATVALVAPPGPEKPGAAPLPLLAHWHYGLGRSVAFTSDCKPRWSKDWVGTEGYSRFWAQALRWVIGDPSAGGLSVESEIDQGVLTVTVDAFDPSGGFRNFLQGEARVVAPDLSVRPLALRQVAPGRYKAEMPVDQDGSWLVGVAMRQGDTVVGQTVAEAVQPYSPEYRRGGVGESVLDEVGRVGGGGRIARPEDVFARPTVPRQVPRPLWPYALGLAALWLLIDIAVRRLEFGAPNLGIAGSLVGAAAASSRPRAAKPAVRTAPIPVGGAVDARSAAEETVAVIREEAAPSAGPAPAAPAPEPGSYAGRLMQARKSARKKMGEDDR
jgi:uncharacterized membrane protein